MFYDPMPWIFLSTCQLVTDILGKVSYNRLYQIGHVLSKIMFYETLKSSIEQCFEAGYTIKLDTTFKFHGIKFHRVAWALNFVF